MHRLQIRSRLRYEKPHDNDKAVSLPMHPNKYQYDTRFKDVPGYRGGKKNPKTTAKARLTQQVQSGRRVSPPVSVRYFEAYSNAKKAPVYHACILFVLPDTARGMIFPRSAPPSRSRP